MSLTFLTIAVIWVISLCFHEYSHARVAFAGGDYTVKDKGYLSFNPLRYMNPVQSILLPLAFMAFFGGIALPGGAVYIETWRLRSRAWNSAVSFAGPAANFIAMILLGLPFVLGWKTDANVESALWPVLAFSCHLQALAFVLNLLPLPGLDGFGVISPWLPPDLRVAANRFAPYSFIILLVLFSSGAGGFTRFFAHATNALCNLVQVPIDDIYIGAASLPHLF